LVFLFNMLQSELQSSEVKINLKIALIRFVHLGKMLTSMLWKNKKFKFLIRQVQMCNIFKFTFFTALKTINKLKSTLQLSLQVEDYTQPKYALQSCKQCIYRNLI